MKHFRTTNTCALALRLGLLLLAWLPAAGAAAQTELLKNPGFEGSYATGAAPEWWVNYWPFPGEPGTPPVFVSQRETRPDLVHSGSAAQLFRVDSYGTGDVHLAQNVKFLTGRTYQASVWLKAASPTLVTLFLRRDGPPYESFATYTGLVGTSWTQLAVKGSFGFDVNGSIRIASRATGVTVWVDDASLTDVTPASLPAPVSAEPIPGTLFGLHINQWGKHWNWPDENQGIIRLWNTATAWVNLEPQQGQWNWDRLDQYVTRTKAYNPDASIIYTMGLTPKWAARDPNAPSLSDNPNDPYYPWGTPSPPKNLDDWRNYVRAVVARYKGKIDYYEIWNEPEGWYHWTGTPEEMVALTRIAREEINRLDPAAKIISPGVGATLGMDWLDRYLAHGGGAVVDIIGYHWYWGLFPENTVPLIDNTRELMQRHGVGHKPLFNTEGANGDDPLNPTGVTISNPTDDHQRGSMARALVLFWEHGVSNFCYHVWESGLVGGDYKTLTPSGVAFREMAGWLKGARLTGHQAAANGTHVYEIRRANGYLGRIVWNEKGNLPFTIPAAWNITTLRRLDATQAQSPGANLTIGLAPVLLETTSTQAALFNGTYTLVAKHSGQAVDVAGAGTANGTNVQQYPRNYSPAQIWKIEPVGEGYYTLTSQASGKVLDVAGIATQDGANVHQWDYLGQANQQWKIEAVGEGYYRLVARHSGKVLDVSGCSTADRANVNQWSWLGGDCQRFRLEPAVVSGATYKLVHKGTNQCLDVAGNSAAEGANVRQWTDNGNDAQRWIITREADGHYKLRHKGTNQCLDVVGNSAAQGADVRQWTDNGNDAQRWRIEDGGEGFAKLTHKGTSQCLDVAGNSAAEGTDVRQWLDNGNDAQRWQLVLIEAPAAANRTAAASTATTTTSLAEPAQLSAYPNPSPDGRATLQLTAKAVQRATVQVYNQQGQFVSLLTVPVKEGQTEFKLPSILAPGTYYLKTRLDGQPQQFTLKVE